MSDAATRSDGGESGWFARTRSRPPRRALDWAASAVDAGARVVGVRALRGAGNAMHVVAVAHDGATRRVVLRRVMSAEPAVVAARGWVAREAAVLVALARHGAPVPEVLAVDPDGSRCDCPAIVMTLLPGWGRPPRRAAPAWLDSLAATLHGLHAGPPDRLPPLPDRLAELTGELAGPPPPSDTDRSTDEAARELLGRRLAELAAAGSVPAVLVHDDYWSGNTLRLGHRVTGVVDWQTAALGPPGLDVGYCAIDLELSYGKEARDHFVAAYERLAGAPVERLAVWELAGVLRCADIAVWTSGWAELGLPVTEEIVAQRLAALEERVTTALRDDH
ncbi:MAG: phosphotransferase family protein [Frankiaceae bacterium]